MNIVFADIDGVLFPHNSKTWSSEAITLLNDLCSRYKMKIVITSSWRLNHKFEILREILREKGVEGEIIGYTPDLSSKKEGDQERSLSHLRVHEINTYLSLNHCDKYIILDDLPLNIQNFVRCRSWKGFSTEEYIVAERVVMGSDPNFDKHHEMRDDILNYFRENPGNTFNQMNYFSDMQKYSTNECSCAVTLLLKMEYIEELQGSPYTDAVTGVPIYPKIYTLTEKGLIRTISKKDYGI